MSILVLIIFYMIFIFLEALNFKREKRKKELYVYSIFMLFSFIISLLLVLGVSIPSYDRFIGKVIFSMLGKE